MKDAIATVEIFAHRGEEPVQRLSLAIGMPRVLASESTVAAASRDPSLAGRPRWSCRVMLANLHRPVEIEGADSVEVLAGALTRARDWLAMLRAEGFELYRDRAGEIPLTLD